MTAEMFIVLALVVGAVVLFVTERLPVDLVALIVMATLLLTGIITPEEGVSGFSNVATVTVAAMFVLSTGLFKTGGVNFVGTVLARLGKINFWLAIIAVMVGVGTISAFLNNTAAVAIFMPIVLGMAYDMRISPSKVLMPLSYASMFGGVCTLIGTSTNILVSSIAERYGQPAFSMFEFAPLGLIMFGVGIAYMLVIGIRLIPNRRAPEDLTKSYGMGDYLTEIVLTEDAKSVGMALQSSSLVKDLDLDVIDVFREGSPVRPLTSWTILRANDVLRVRCDIEKLKALQERQGILLKPDTNLWDKELKSEDATLVEAVIAPNSILEGKSLTRIRFRHYFGATVLAIRHRGEVMHENLEVTPLQAGDVLLLRARVDQLDPLKQDSAFVIVSEVGLPQFRRRKILPALAIVTAVVAAAAIGLAPIVVSAVIGCVVMVLARVLTLDEAYQSIEWKVIFLLAGVLTLGVALEKTGTAAFLANGMVGTVGLFGPIAIVSALYLLTSLMTEAMSNNATAALLAPIAIATADSLGLDSRPFLMAVTFAASASFMTPVGYQTNTLIYGAGQYKFADFLRVGTPLNFIFWIVATVMIPRIWPF